ncbi:neurocalcin-like protein [Dinothrombium tinctorium]|uniref:Neurocalcin-like protein n=1 Tax=Dinothrombium tinctorium TaxID=1965070 RepID=A0A443RES7_9ACAR|nr:neurocalcin-like protein [Dinothrombium tinctorium]RWS12250.1 neurocalcin-like protein [Dinothrombium tinctorium]RWS13760.1 neurocalcin-like protein [Dinothrombium tinctorium]
MADEKRLLSEEDVHYILRNSFLVEEEMRQWYDNFQVDCPDGRLDKPRLIEMYRKFYKKGSPEEFCDLLFRVLDRDGNGTVEFMEFLLALGVMTSSDPNERLKWAFRLFDINQNGFIEQSEMVSVVSALYEMLGRHLSIDGEEEGEEDMASAVENAFSRMDINQDGQISQDEFIEICKKVPRLARALKLDR